MVAVKTMVGEKRLPFEKSFVVVTLKPSLVFVNRDDCHQRAFQKVHFMITQEYLKECLTYNPKTGVFTWLKRPRHHFGTDRGWKMFNSRNVGKPAGHEWPKKNSRTSYMQIGIDGQKYLAHRLAWLYIHGTWPDNSIDHIDGSGLNNKLINLRDVTPRQNSMNRKTNLNNSSGFKGVYFDKSKKKFRAYIDVNGKKKMLGYFTSLEAAKAAREAADLEHGYTTPDSENAPTAQIEGE